MTVQRTINKIAEELSHIETDLEPWFNRETELIEFLPQRGWDIGQILEHITLTNHFLLILIRKGAQKALQEAAKGKLEQELASYTYNLGRLDDIANNKAFTWMRPEHMEPRGEQELAEVHSNMRSQFAECARLLADLGSGEGILHKTTMSVNNLGKIDVYQYIYFLCLHARRHIAQMERVEAEYRERVGSGS